GSPAVDSCSLPPGYFALSPGVTDRSIAFPVRRADPIGRIPGPAPQTVARPGALLGGQSMNRPLDPSHIMQTATAFWASKVLLTAVELDLFSTLGGGAMTAAQLGDKLKLHPRGTYDFFDAQVALKFLDRDGDGPEGRYK